MAENTTNIFPKSKRISKKQILESISIIGGTLLSLIPYIQESANMDTLSWIFFGTGVSLVAFGVLYGIFKQEKHLNWRDKEAITKTRKPIVIEFQTQFHKRFKLLQELKNKAEKTPLEKYQEKYLDNTPAFMVKNHKSEKPLIIIQSLARHGFLLNNLHYQFLKETDTSYQFVVSEYNLKLAQIRDSQLNQLMKTFWVREHQVRSTIIYASLSMNNPKIPNIPIGYIGGLSGKHMTEKVLQDLQSNIEKRIEELINGDDLNE